jgi:hypothetical protein
MMSTAAHRCVPPRFTPDEAAVARAAAVANLTPYQIASALKRPPRMVIWNLEKMSLAPPRAPAPVVLDAPKPQARLLWLMLQDRRFKHAMLAAIKAGHENPFVGVFRSKRSETFARSIRPTPIALRSSAGWMADPVSSRQGG